MNNTAEQTLREKIEDAKDGARYFRRKAEKYQRELDRALRSWENEEKIVADLSAVIEEDD